MEGVSCIVGQQGDCRGEKEPSKAWGDRDPSPVHLEGGDALDVSTAAAVVVTHWLL